MIGHIRRVGKNLALVVLGLLLSFSAVPFAWAATDIGVQTFRATREFTGVDSCGERVRQEDEARTACKEKVRDLYGSVPSISLVTDPPQFSGDSSQKTDCKGGNVLGVCIDPVRRCDGKVDVTCEMSVIFP